MAKGIVTVGDLPVRPFGSVDEAAQFLVSDGTVRPGFAASVNAEIVVMAQEDAELREILVNAMVCYADGFGAQYVVNKKGHTNSRVPGCELWEAVCRCLAEANATCLIYGATPEVNNSACQKLVEENKQKIVGAYDGYNWDQEYVLNKIVELKPAFVTVALGCPRQEMFIKQALKIHPDALYMGVGGTLDVYSGSVKRAPGFIQNIGLEWLYRIVINPSRIGRSGRFAIFVWQYLKGNL